MKSIFRTALLIVGLCLVMGLATAQTTITESVVAGLDQTSSEASAELTSTALLITGVVLLILEVKIMSFGILGLLGGVCLTVAGSMIWKAGVPFWGIPAIYVIPMIVVTFGLFVALAILAIRAHQEKVVTGYQGYIGEIAEASEDLQPEGRVFFQGTYWQAVSRLPVTKGTRVRVVAADRLKLVVEPLDPAPSEHGTN